MLTDQQVAALRDLGLASSFDEKKKAEVLGLVARGYIERDGDLFRLTAMGLKGPSRSTFGDIVRRFEQGLEI